MMAVSRAWGRLTVPGKVVFTVVPILILLTAGLIAVIALFGGTAVDILAANLGICTESGPPQRPDVPSAQ